MIAAADCIALAREYLNDKTQGSYRWGDALLLSFLNQALTDLFRDRPDLMMDETGKCVTDASFDAVEGGAVFLDEKYAGALSLGCAARALELDNSDTANTALADRLLARARSEWMK